MGEPTQILFSFTEIAEALIKKENIHEGNWGILVKFNIAGVNAPGPKGTLVPTAMIPITQLGIQQFDEANDLTVDAAEVNPDRTVRRRPGGKRATSKKAKK